MTDSPLSDKIRILKIGYRTHSGPLSILMEVLKNVDSNFYLQELIAYWPLWFQTTLSTVCKDIQIYYIYDVIVFSKTVPIAYLDH